jgi:hypothetical protein
MSSTTRASAVKRVLASASLGAAAVGIGSVAREFEHWDRSVLGVAALVGVAAVGLGRRSVLSQVLSRGVAWVLLTPMLVGLADALGHGRLPDAYTVFFATTSASALLLARPALHTDEAKAEFSPVAYRRTFLAGAVAAVMAGMVVLLFAAEQLIWRQSGHGLALAVFGSAFLASAVGVVRMRSWGVLLGALTALVALGAAVFAGNEFTAIGLALAAIPGALLASPLLAARLRGSAARPSASADRRRLELTIEEGEDAAPPIFARVEVAAEAERHELAQPVRVAVGQK